MNRLLLLLLVLFAEAAIAGDIAVTCTQPTTNIDGSAIPATGPGSLASNRFEWGSCVGGAFGTRIGDKTVTPAACSTTITGLLPATYCVRAYATNTYGRESAASNVATKAIDPPTPNPPIVTTAIVVYDVTSRGRVGRYVGSIAKGVACGPPALTTAAGKTWYELPRSAVTLTRQPRSAVVIGKCGAA